MGKGRFQSTNLVKVLLMRSQGAEFFLLSHFCQALLQYLSNQYLQQWFNLSASSSSAWHSPTEARFHKHNSNGKFDAEIWQSTRKWSPQTRGQRRQTCTCHLLYMSSRNPHNPVINAMVSSCTHSCIEVMPLLAILRHHRPRPLQHTQHSNRQQLRYFAQSGKRRLYTSPQCQERHDLDLSRSCCQIL